MDCSEFREKFQVFDAGQAPGGITGAAFGSWSDHFHDCRACQDWGLAQRVRNIGEDPEAFACIHMAYYATQTCDQHPNRAECDDLLIEHDAGLDEYLLIKGQVRMRIDFCPWCGVRLPPSKR